MQLFRCHRYRAQMTREACRTYAERNPDACRGCEGVTGICLEPRTEPKEDDMAKMGQCVTCGLEKKIIARGLCEACYYRARRSEKRTGSCPEPDDQDPPRGTILQIRFGPDDVGLYSALADAARRERRTVDQQIIWILEDRLRQHGRPVSASGKNAVAAGRDAHVHQ